MQLLSVGISFSDKLHAPQIFDLYFVVIKNTCNKAQTKSLFQSQCYFNNSELPLQQMSLLLY